MSGAVTRSKIETLSAAVTSLIGRPIGLIAGLELRAACAIAYASKQERRSPRRKWAELSLRSGQW
ncbi:hypothetical protein [Bradyrhizobium valentinum]|nr:hypothetical protein [Bradyrhizobium valentinum]